MSTTSRLYTIIAIGLSAVLSVAVVLTAITVTRNNVLSRSTRSEDGKSEGKRCPLTANKLQEALSKICDSRKDVLMDVSYGVEKLKCGDSTTVEKTGTTPTIKLKHADEKAQYTVVMVDPDAPGHSLENLKFYLHWVVTGTGLKNGINSPVTLMSYAGPTPPKGSGVHHYKLIVFQSSLEQNGKPHLIQDNKKRNQFSLTEFVKENKFCTIVGLFEFTVAADKK
ncbi:protein D1-like [Mercenaria mercenaria]|uniref:protein D1-like n=1 Tax=Mercenaria mercenaria TaxID=6596 RepID=UPI00234E4C8E|nr:protein D1-like [Mercenaria mercenaria]